MHRLTHHALWIAVLVAPLAASTAHAGHGFVLHHHRQDARIRDGVADGDLTRPEARALVHEQHEIADLRRDMARDGHLDHTERRILRQEQEEASRHIRRLRHNDAER